VPYVLKAHARFNMYFPAVEKVPLKLRGLDIEKK